MSERTGAGGGGKANLDDDFNFTWLSVSEDIIVLTHGTTDDTFENVKLNVIKQVKVEEKDYVKQSAIKMEKVF